MNQFEKGKNGGHFLKFNLPSISVYKEALTIFPEICDIFSEYDWVSEIFKKIDLETLETTYKYLLRNQDCSKQQYGSFGKTSIGLLTNGSCTIALENITNNFSWNIKWEALTFTKNLSSRNIVSFFKPSSDVFATSGIGFLWNVLNSQTKVITLTSVHDQNWKEICSKY